MRLAKRIKAREFKAKDVTKKHEGAFTMRPGPAQKMRVKPSVRVRHKRRI